MTDNFPVLIIAVPLIAAFILPIVSMAGVKPRNILVFFVILAVNLMILSLIPDVMIKGKVLYSVIGSAEPMRVIPEGLTFPIRIVLRIDGFSLFMAILSGLFSLVSFMFSIKFITDDGRKNYYVLLMLLMMAGMLGLEFSNDLFNFFVFLEILSISGAALISYRTDLSHPPYAGYKYLLVSTIATSFFLIGVAICYAQYGSLNMEYIHRFMNHTLLDRMALIFMLAALAMKAGIVPMHMWVPDAYSEAPAPVTAMLVIASQACLYGLFRICFTLFGNPIGRDTINYHTLGWIIIVMGILSMFVGVTMALVQHDVKRLMAFHSVSQTGYILMGLGVGIAVYSLNDGGKAFHSYGRLAMAGGIFHIMNYTLSKGLLFLTAGVMFRRFGTNDLDRMVGLAHRDTYTSVVYIIGALAISGIPPFNAFSSKLLLYESVYQFSPVLSIIAMFVSVLTLASFTKVFYSAFLGPRREDILVDRRPLPAGMIAGMGIVALVIIVIGFFPSQTLNMLVDPAISGLVTIF